jgi:hypothetical protein
VTVQDATNGKILARQPVPDGGSNATASYQAHLIFDMQGSDVVMKLQVLSPLQDSQDRRATSVTLVNYRTRCVTVHSWLR